MTAPSYRVLTADALTGAWLSKALPLTDLAYGPELNGPGSITGTLTPRLLASDPSLVVPGSTCIFVERDGRIVEGGLVWDVRTQGEEYRIEAASWSSYLQRRHDIHGNFRYRGPYVSTDPCEIIRDIWTYAQEAHDGDLGVLVDDTVSAARVGTTAEPYTSPWWEFPVLGDRVDDLVSAAGSPDYTCTTAWDATRTVPVKRIRLGYPRLGARRTDISFASGINIIDPPEIPLAGDEYAQVVIASGSGEGSAKKRSVQGVRNGRLRLEHVLDLPDVRTTEALAAHASAERAWRQTLGAVEQITVRHHPAAPVGSWQVGDDVHVRVHNAWTDFSGWCRITGWTITPHAPGGEQALLSLRPAESFHYGRPT